MRPIVEYVWSPSGISALMALRTAFMFWFSGRIGTLLEQISWGCFRFWLQTPWAAGHECDLDLSQFVCP